VSNISQPTDPQPLSLGRAALSLELDAALLARVERLSGGDRDRAIREALERWCQHQEQQQRYRTAQQRRAQQERDETGWLV